MEKRTKIIIIAVLLLTLGVIGITLLPYKAPTIIELEILPYSEDNSKEPLFQLRSNNAASLQAWNKRLNESLKEYHDSTAAVERVVCSYSTSISGDEKRACDVPLDNFYPCAGGPTFQSTHICVFLRLTKIAKWTPEVYNNTMGLPYNMPEDLKMHIKMVSDTPTATTVWVTCKGETPADEEFIGPVQYLPQRGFPAYYFPYTNQKGYLSPLVAVLFERPSLGILFNVACTAWAKNIKNDAEEEQATARFSMLID